MNILKSISHFIPLSFLERGVGVGLLLFLVLPLFADDYNPVNPADPSMKYKVTATVTPAEAGTASTSGKYAVGTTVTMNTSAKSTDYKFQYWTLNGEKYSENKQFTYTVTAANADFVAVYTYEPQEEETVIYDPTNPSDPNVVAKPEVTHTYYTLTLASSPDDACSFNITSGISVEEDTYVKLEAYGNQGYDFVGWYQGGSCVSTASSFNYQMTADVTLTAMYTVYSPDDPDDPSATKDNTAYEAGDIDKSGTVNVSDAVDLITEYLNNTTDKLIKSIADVDNNGVINVSDAVEIIQIYLNNK